MSQVRVQGNASGTGILTVTSPNTNSNYTLTLPAQTGTILTNASTTGFPAGSVLQVVNYNTGAVATGSTYIPKDDTIPQITEGTEFMTLAITPTSATSKLVIDVLCNLNIGNSNLSLTVALFQDSTANALAAVGMSYYDSPDIAPVFLRHYMTAGTTSSTTFRVRAGKPSGAAVVTLNGATSSRLYGGVYESSITIWEIAA